jgi:uracil-DNA glycosylase family 4
MPPHQPPADCPLCPRLAAFRAENRVAHPTYYNGAVPSFGALDAPMLIVGLAPGLHGANATGRPFTGDYAGKILYPALHAHGFARGAYGERPDDGFTLVGCRVTNAVRCVPPQNKPEPSEIKTCNQFLKNEIAAMPHLRLILSLGAIAHNAVLTAFAAKKSAHTFAHSAEHALPGVTLLNTYHTSRYNINTGVLTPAMFDAIIARARVILQEKKRHAG